MAATTLLLLEQAVGDNFFPTSAIIVSQWKTLEWLQTRLCSIPIHVGILVLKSVSQLDRNHLLPF